MNTDELSMFLADLIIFAAGIIIFVLVCRFLLSVIRYFNKKSKEIDDKINNSVDKMK